MVALLNYREDGVTPYFTMWKDGLKGEFAFVHALRESQILTCVLFCATMYRDEDLNTSSSLYTYPIRKALLSLPLPLLHAQKVKACAPTYVLAPALPSSQIYALQRRLPALPFLFISVRARDVSPRVLLLFLFRHSMYTRPKGFAQGGPNPFQTIELGAELGECESWTEIDLLI